MRVGHQEREIKIFEKANEIEKQKFGKIKDLEKDYICRSKGREKPNI